MTDEEPTCDGWSNPWRQCNPDHPIHCCHFSTTVTMPASRRGYVLMGFRCHKCGKQSRTWTMVRRTEGPTV